jgi:hypothetical protein
MTLRFHYIGPADLLNKLERERYRTFHSAADLQKEAMCDHFFNFCVTAHALRDWFKKTPDFPIDLDIHKKCNIYPELEACRDIANSNKHFNFEPKPKTKGAIIGVSKVVDVFENENGDLKVTEPRGSIEMFIEIEGEPIRESHEFMDKVIEIWRSILDEFSIQFESIYGEQHRKS